MTRSFTLRTSDNGGYVVDIYHYQTGLEDNNKTYIFTTKSDLIDWLTKEIV
jgi:hypothetical protein